MTRTDSLRLKAIQKWLKVEPDGDLGPQTLTALEKLLGLDSSAAATSKSTNSNHIGIRLSKSGVTQIVNFEVGSKAYYEKRLQQPIWPGGDSGVTIGIGYDLGYQTPEIFEQHWQAELPAQQLNQLKSACGVKGTRAKLLIPDLAEINISYDAAIKVFSNISLYEYAKSTLKTYPGVENLYPDAQTALVSLIYNRGTSLKDTDKRKEMRAIVDQVATADYQGIANSILGMKRLWGPNLAGLLKRRDVEAELVLKSKHPYSDAEILAL